MFVKKIVDISLKKDTVNVERRLNLTCAELEKQLLNVEYSYTGNNLPKDYDAEKAKLPPFIVSFYYYIFYKLSVPTEQQLIKEYYQMNGFEYEGDFVTIENKKIAKKGIEARLLRSYPSLMRDLHFYLLLTESQLFEDVFYSLRTDYVDGLDLKIKYKNRKYFLSIYIGTKRGEFYKTKKKNRHDYSDFVEIELAVNFETLKKYGDFYLLGNNHLKELISKLESLC